MLRYISFQPACHEDSLHEQVALLPVYAVIRPQIIDRRPQFVVIGDGLVSHRQGQCLQGSKWESKHQSPLLLLRQQVSWCVLIPIGRNSQCGHGRGEHKCPLLRWFFSSCRLSVGPQCSSSLWARLLPAYQQGFRDRHAPSRSRCR
jgi:hypothetical protein